MPDISSKENKLIKNIIKLQKSSKARKKEGLFVCEGVRLCVDAMLSGAGVEALLVTENAAEKHSAEYLKLKKTAAQTYTVLPAVFKLISDTQTPQGFLCVIKTLDKNAEFDTIKVDGKFIALDNVQDPNNLGTILRSIEAFGADGVIFSRDCCDIYNPKAVRGSMGAVFRIPFLICETIEGFLIENPSLISYAAVVDPAAVPVTECTFKPPCAVVIGNEGNGLKPGTVAACRHKITIPMKGKAESLNAAAAASILVWELMK